MPQEFSNICEPNGELISSRIKTVSYLRSKGWDVRYSFAPIIVHDGWLTYYRELFKLLPNRGEAECIFLTALPGDIFFNEDLMEQKQPTHGRVVWRYKHKNKRMYISLFKDVLKTHLQYVKPAYIF